MHAIERILLLTDSPAEKRAVGRHLLSYAEAGRDVQVLSEQIETLGSLLCRKVSGGVAGLDTLQRLTNLSPDALRRLDKVLADVPEPLRLDLAHEVLLRTERGQDPRPLCALAKFLNFYPRNSSDAFWEFAHNHSAQDVEDLVALTARFMGENDNGEVQWEILQNARDMLRVPPFSERQEEGIRLGVTARYRFALVRLQARYPELDIIQAHDWLASLWSSERPVADFPVPESLSTFDEGHLIAVLSRTLPYRPRPRHNLVQAGVRSWVNVHQADAEILLMLQSQRTTKDTITEVLNRHPNPHGIWGDNTMMHWASILVSRSEVNDVSVLLHYFHELGRLGVNLAVGNMNRHTPYIIAGQAFHRGWELKMVRDVILFYSS